MSDKIEKLSNVEFVITDEVLNRKWIDVISRRNKLLTISDWTQIGDVDIPQNIRNLWRRWRQKVRNIKRSTINSPDKAMSLLTTLEKQMPKKIIDNDSTIKDKEVLPQIPTVNSGLIDDMRKYVEEHINSTYAPKIISMEDISSLLDQRLTKAIDIILENVNTAMDKKITASKKQFNLSTNVGIAKLEILNILNIKCDSNLPKINDDLLNEAIDYVTTHAGHYPLLNVYAKHNKLSLDDMANKLINEKKNAIKEVCKLEDYRLQYMTKIDDANSYEELLALYNEITNGH